MALSGLPSAPGYCAVTGGEKERGCSASRHKGYFEGIFATANACLVACISCSRCRFVSYSKRMNDCSWFSVCSLARLRTGESRFHTTFLVRHVNGSVDPAVQVQLLQAHEQRMPFTFVRPRHVLFHEQSAELMYLLSERPRFRAMPGGVVQQLRSWTQSTERGQWGYFHTREPTHATCAVVGSGSSLLERSHGARIDRHDAVFRVNEAPPGSKFAQHVGRRTTVRVWGVQHLPDMSGHWAVAEEALVVYCGPVTWVGQCWSWIPTSPRPRFSPFAWQQVSIDIHGETTTNVKSQLPRAQRTSTTVPSSGAMSVWLALAMCRNVSVFGFGWCDATADTRVGAVYYDPTDRRNKIGFARYHDLPAEWRWLRRLHSERVLTQVC